MEGSPVHTVVNFEVTDRFCNVIFIDQSHRTFAMGPRMCSCLQNYSNYTHNYKFKLILQCLSSLNLCLALFCSVLNGVF